MPYLYNGSFDNGLCGCIMSVVDCNSNVQETDKLCCNSFSDGTVGNAMLFHIMAVKEAVNVVMIGMVIRM